MNWYKFDPIDTLFFKGAHPMQLGENHFAPAVFPPPVETITGALRTAIIKQKAISIADYYAGKIESSLQDILGPASGKAGFSVCGPFFSDQGEVFVPAPFHWYVEKDEVEKTKNLLAKDKQQYKFSLIHAQSTSSALIATQVKPLFWAKGKELESLGGSWIPLANLAESTVQSCIRKTDDFFVNEPRTGIALEHEKKTVRESHLYQFTHARLNVGIAIIFAVDKELPLTAEGILMLGAEQRFGKYQKDKRFSFPALRNSGLFISLAPLEGSDEVNNEVLAAGKILYLGGWDMMKGFHKLMKGYFPSGSVFKKKFNSNMLEL